MVSALRPQAFMLWGREGTLTRVEEVLTHVQKLLKKTKELHILIATMQNIYFLIPYQHFDIRELIRVFILGKIQSSCELDTALLAGPHAFL